MNLLKITFILKEFIINHIIIEIIKKAFRSRINYGKNIGLRQLKLIKYKRDVLKKRSFHKKEDEISNDPIIWYDNLKIVPIWWKVDEIIYKAHINRDLIWKLS